MLDEPLELESTGASTDVAPPVVSETGAVVLLDVPPEEPVGTVCGPQAMIASSPRAAACHCMPMSGRGGAFASSDPTATSRRWCACRFFIAYTESYVALMCSLAG